VLDSYSKVHTFFQHCKEIVVDRILINYMGNNMICIFFSDSV